MWGYCDLVVTTKYYIVRIGFLWPHVVFLRVFRRVPAVFRRVFCGQAPRCPWGCLDVRILWFSSYYKVLYCSDRISVASCCFLAGFPAGSRGFPVGSRGFPAGFPWAKGSVHDTSAISALRSIVTCDLYSAHTCMSYVYLQRRHVYIHVCTCMSYVYLLSQKKPQPCQA